MKTKILGTTEQDISLAAEIIKNGGLVAFPTETVYGLGANALDEAAVRKVYEAKGRPSDNPMIVHISSFDDMGKLTDMITDDIRSLMAKLWPGPLTMVVPARDIIPKVTTGGLDTVAVRMPSGEVAAALIKESGVPIAAPSANISGRPSPTTYKHCIDDLSGRVDAIICGAKCEIGIESTVVDMTGDIPVILRPGIITRENLSDILGKEVKIDPYILLKPDMPEARGIANIEPLAKAKKNSYDSDKSECDGLSLKSDISTMGDITDKSQMEIKKQAQDTAMGKGAAVQINPSKQRSAQTGEENSTQMSVELSMQSSEYGGELKPKSPGVKYKHYAPRAEMFIIRGEAAAVKKAMDEKKRELESGGKKVELIYYSAEHPEIAASEFFGALREADEKGVDIILASALPEEGVGFAVMNRMFKSAGYNIIDV